MLLVVKNADRGTAEVKVKCIIQGELSEALYYLLGVEWSLKTKL